MVFSARGAIGARLKTLQASGQLTVHTGFHIRQQEVDGDALRVIGEQRAKAGWPAR